MRIATGVLVCAACLWLAPQAWAQPAPRGGGPPAPPASPRASAPIDLTGY